MADYLLRLAAQSGAFQQTELVDEFIPRIRYTEYDSRLQPVIGFVLSSQIAISNQEALVMEIHIGRVTHFYSQIYVAVLKLTSEINTGDMVHLFGHTTDFFQLVKSMEIDHRPVRTVAAGQEVALKVVHPVRKGDFIYKVPEDEAGQVTIEGPTFLESDH